MGGDNLSDYSSKGSEHGSQLSNRGSQLSDEGSNVYLSEVADLEIEGNKYLDTTDSKLDTSQLGSKSSLLDDSSSLGTNLFADMLTSVETDSDDTRLKFLPCGDIIEYALIFDGKMIFTFSIQQIRNIYNTSHIVRLCNIENKRLASAFLMGNLSDEGVVVFLNRRFKGLLSEVGYKTYLKEDLDNWYTILGVTRGISLLDSAYIVPLLQKLASKKNKHKFGRLPNTDKDVSAAADQYMSLTSLFGPGPRLYSLDDLAANDEIAPFDSLANIQSGMPIGIIRGNVFLKGGKTKLSNDYLQHRSIVFRNCEVTFEPYAEMMGSAILNLINPSSTFGSMAVAHFVECAKHNQNIGKQKSISTRGIQAVEQDTRLGKQCVVVARKIDFLSESYRSYRTVNATHFGYSNLKCIEDLCKYSNYQDALNIIKYCITDALVLNSARKLADFENIYKGKDEKHCYIHYNLDQAFKPTKFVDVVNAIRRDSAWGEKSLDESPDNRIKYLMQCKMFNNYVDECLKLESPVWGVLTNVIAVFEMFCSAQLSSQNSKASYEIGDYIQSIDSNLARYSADYKSEFCGILRYMNNRLLRNYEYRNQYLIQLRDIAFTVKGLTKLDPIFVASVCSCGVELHFDLICVMTAVIRRVAGIICQHIDAICKYMRIAPIYAQDNSTRIFVDKKLHLSFVDCDISTRLNKFIAGIQSCALNQFNGLGEGSIKLLTNPKVVESLPYYQNIRESQKNRSESDLESERYNLEVQRKLLYPEISDEEYEVKLQESVLQYADAIQKYGDNQRFTAPAYSSLFISSLCKDPNDISLLFDKKGPLRVRCMDQNAKLIPVPIVASYRGLFSDINKIKNVLIEYGGFQIDSNTDIIRFLSVTTEERLSNFISKLTNDNMRTLSIVLTRVFDSFSTLSLRNAIVICDFSKSLYLASKRKNTLGVVLFGELYRNLQAKLDDVSQCISSRQLFSEPLVRDVFNCVLNNPGISLKDLIAKFSMKGRNMQSVSRLTNLETQEVVLKAVVSLLESDYLSIRNSQIFTDYLYYQLDLGRRGFHEYFEVYERLKQQFDNIPSKFDLIVNNPK